MKKIIIILFFGVLCGFHIINAQNITITDDQSHDAHSSAVLDVYSTSKGMLFPRMTTIEMNTIADPIESLVVYNTDLSAFYIFDGSIWKPLVNDSDNLWQFNTDAIYLNDLTLKVGIGTNSPSSKLEVVGDANFPLEEPLFKVLNNNGDTVFAVYNEGIRVNISSGSKAGSPGGFAIGGITTKQGGEEYFRITRDSARIWLNTDATKGSPGGFAIGGVTTKSGQDFFDITEENCFIGYESGNNSDNTINNIFIGYKAGYNTQGNDPWAKNNVFIGYESGLNNTTGSNNLFMGTNSGRHSISGYNNIFLGNNVGTNNNHGVNNVFIGTNSGYNNMSGNNNVFIGNSAGRLAQNTHRNIFIGVESGYQSEGIDNVFIGYQAGFNELDSNKFILSNINCGDDPLIYGNFLENQHELKLNADVIVRDQLDISAQPYKPKIFEQTTEPDIPTNTSAFWHNTSNDTYWLITDFNDIQKKLEMN